MVQFSAVDSPSERVNKLASAFSDLERRMARLTEQSAGRRRTYPISVDSFGKVMMSNIAGSGFLERTVTGEIKLKRISGANAYEPIDYFDAANTSGWAVNVAGSVQGLRIGQMFFCIFEVTGTSNATFAEITLPYAPALLADAYFPIRVKDDSSLQVSNGTVEMRNGDPTISLHPDNPLNLWVAAGTKSVWGSLFYRIIS